MTDHKAAFGTLTADIKTIDTKEPAGEFEAILSMPTLDRDGEVIDPRAFEPLPEHITIDVDHGMTTDTTDGSGQPFYDGDTLMFRGTFSTLPRAQEVRTLVTEGHVRKMSVAFMNALREDDDSGITHIRRAELLNAAIVPIPSNREASILAAKAAKAHAEEMADEATYIADRTFTVNDIRSIEGLPPIATAEEEQKAAAPAPAIGIYSALANAEAVLAEASLLTR